MQKLPRPSLSNTRFRHLFPSLNQRYDRIAGNWHNTISRLGYLEAYGSLVNSQKFSLARLSHKNTLRILDVGTGSGGFSMALVQKFTRPLTFDLLDISPNMLGIAESNLKPFNHPIRKFCMPMEEFVSDGPPYDLILCAHVVEHCSNPGAVLAKLKTSLAPNGTLLLSVSKPHWCTALVQLRWGSRAFSPHRVMEMLKNTGFTEIFAHPFQDGPPKFTSCGYIASAPSPTSG